MRISIPEDTGRIRVVSNDARGEIHLAIEADRGALGHRQWFCFDGHGGAGREQILSMINASECTYADAFDDYRVCASYDPEGTEWFRVPTEMRDGALRILHTPEQDRVRYAYFAPYLRSRRQRVIAAAVDRGARVREVARSVKEEAISILTFGSKDNDALKLWITAQQHPGETMAGWFAEGLVGRLVDENDEVTKTLLEHASVHVVLCMNPDGATMGNHRTNATGNDLNRAWWEADISQTPEVLGVRAAMYEEGVDFFLDVHGDEHVPSVFVAGSEGNPHYTDRIEALEHEFDEAMLEASSDFQTDEGYPKDAPGKGDLRCASNYVGEAFDCLSLTLEMPFKDNANAPDENTGWSPVRSMRLGGATVETMASLLDVLR